VRDIFAAAALRSFSNQAPWPTWRFDLAGLAQPMAEVSRTQGATGQAAQSAASARKPSLEDCNLTPDSQRRGLRTCRGTPIRHNASFAPFLDRTMLRLNPPVVLLLMSMFSSGCSGPSTERGKSTADSPGSQPLPTHYTIRVDAARPLELEASLDLHEFPGLDRTAGVQGTGFGLASQVQNVHCDGAVITASADGLWTLPNGCRRLQWTVAVRVAAPLAVDASEQESLFFENPGWWLLSEPTSLLRVSSAAPGRDLDLQIIGEPSGTQQVGGAILSERSWRVPPLGSAPEFFAIGMLHSRALEMGALKVTYVFDDPLRVEQLPLETAHRRMLDRLLTVFTMPEDGAPPHLLVVWLGVDARHGQAGGAAGSRSFLANYVVGESADADLNAVRTLLILAHEQVHQLVDVAKPASPLPTWAAESLAQFYGLSSLRHSGLAESSVQRAFAHFIDPHRPVDAGLRALEDRHAAGDADAYASFYTQGATFWFEVDRILRAHGVAEGLDEHLPAVLSAGFEGSDLSPALSTELVRIGGTEMEEVLKRYL
jgi:hypothetical protein